MGSGHRVAVPRPPGEGAGRHRSSENPEMREPGGRPLIRRRHPERTEGRPVPPRLNRAGRAAPWPGRACPGVTALPAPRHFPEPEPQTDSPRGSPRCPRPSAHLSAWTEFLPQGPQSPWPLPKRHGRGGPSPGPKAPRAALAVRRHSHCVSRLSRRVAGEDVAPRAAGFGGSGSAPYTPSRAHARLVLADRSQALGVAVKATLIQIRAI